MSRRHTDSSKLISAALVKPHRTAQSEIVFPDGTIIRLLPGEQLEPAKLKVAEKREIIVETERALRAVVREVYAAQFRETAAQRIEEALPERERESLARVLRARPILQHLPHQVGQHRERGRIDKWCDS